MNLFSAIGHICWKLRSLFVSKHKQKEKGMWFCLWWRALCDDTIFLKLVSDVECHYLTSRCFTYKLFFAEMHSIISPWFGGGGIILYQILKFIIYMYFILYCTVILQSSLEILMNFYIFLKFLHLQYLFFKVTGVGVCQY